jgi:hypothetical protein
MNVPDEEAAKLITALCRRGFGRIYDDAAPPTVDLSSSLQLCPSCSVTHTDAVHVAATGASLKPVPAVRSLVGAKANHHSGPRCACSAEANGAGRPNARNGLAKDDRRAAVAADGDAPQAFESPFF